MQLGRGFDRSCWLCVGSHSSHISSSRAGGRHHLQLPNPAPAEPAETVQSMIKINLGKKRYGIEIATKAYELQAKPAEVIEMPKKSGSYAARRESDLGLISRP
jgi:hypothetical protein